MNDINDYTFQPYCDAHLIDCEVSVGTSLPKTPSRFDLIILWSYRKILTDCDYNNVVIFHSSDIPKGKGWSPIFNAFQNELEVFTISVILLDEKVDSGDVVAKAKFSIRPNFTAKHIRKFDEEISVMLIHKILERFNGNVLKGVSQNLSEETFYKRRWPRDGKINKNKTLKSLIPFLRGCEKHHPAFFEFNGCEYVIHVEPVREPKFPNDLTIEFLV